MNLRRDQRRDLVNPQDLVIQLETSKEYFDRTTSVLTEADSSYAPAEGMMTVAQQLAHAAHSVDWFVEGAFREEGFDLDFSKFEVAQANAKSLEEGRAWLDRAYAAAVEAFGRCSEEELAAALPPGPVLGGRPRFAIVVGILEHTAHHRGSLAVYARNLGRQPAAPYGEM